MYSRFPVGSSADHAPQNLYQRLDEDILLFTVVFSHV